MTIIASDLVKKSSGIYALPEIHNRLTRKLEDPSASNAQIADIVQLDAGLSASLLKIVNSAFYGFPSSISTISQAISIIGRTELADLVLGQSAMNVFSHLKISKKALNDHWHHSLLCGLVARQMAGTVENCEQSPESLFVAGLLHDIGKLVIWNELPDQSSQLIKNTGGASTDYLEAEQSEFGFGHTEVGAQLLNNWKLPEMLIAAARHHHSPHSAENFKQACQIVFIANEIAQTDKLDEAFFDWINSGKAAEQLGYDLQKMSDNLEIANSQFSEMSAMFSP
ncbi:MAG: HDOD domain-containing protein [Gammaproteobacteria bacterium]|nr:HDOD domain-containing protein [Gammaproteobacteria bacterium]